MEGADTTVWVSESFVSVQGEGKLTGTPSLFIRLSGCNLRCHFCDTPYASWEPVGEQVSIARLLATLDDHPRVRHAVLTGGEPMLAKNFDALVRACHARGLHVTIETAGTVWPASLAVAAELWSISPKLASSAPPAASGWRERHEAARVADTVLKKMLAAPGDHQLKFVAGSEADLQEIDAWVERLEARPEDVLVMPEGISVEALNAVSRWLVPAVIERGWRYADRLHIRLFGHTPGT
jgi:7-carboxy-7-deazaguanine synthase